MRASGKVTDYERAKQCQLSHPFASQNRNTRTRGRQLDCVQEGLTFQQRQIRRALRQDLRHEVRHRPQVCRIILDQSSDREASTANVSW